MRRRDFRRRSPGERVTALCWIAFAVPGPGSGSGAGGGSTLKPLAPPQVHDLCVVVGTSAGGVRVYALDGSLLIAQRVDVGGADGGPSPVRALHARDARRSPSRDDPAEDITVVLDAAVVRVDALELRSSIRRASLCGSNDADGDGSLRRESLRRESLRRRRRPRRDATIRRTHPMEPAAAADGDAMDLSRVAPVADARASVGYPFVRARGFGVGGGPTLTDGRGTGTLAAGLGDPRGDAGVVALFASYEDRENVFDAATASARGAATTAATAVSSIFGGAIGLAGAVTKIFPWAARWAGRWSGRCPRRGTRWETRRRARWESAERARRGGAAEARARRGLGQRAHACPGRSRLAWRSSARRSAKTRATNHPGAARTAVRAAADSLGRVAVLDVAAPGALTSAKTLKGCRDAEVAWVGAAAEGHKREGTRSHRGGRGDNLAVRSPHRNAGAVELWEFAGGGIVVRGKRRAGGAGEAGAAGAGEAGAGAGAGEAGGGRCGHGASAARGREVAASRDAVRVRRRRGNARGGGRAGYRGVAVLSLTADGSLREVSASAGANEEMLNTVDFPTTLTSCVSSSRHPHLVCFLVAPPQHGSHHLVRSHDGRGDGFRGVVHERLGARRELSRDEFDHLLHPIPPTTLATACTSPAAPHVFHDEIVQLADASRHAHLGEDPRGDVFQFGDVLGEIRRRVVEGRPRESSVSLAEDVRGAVQHVERRARAGVLRGEVSREFGAAPSAPRVLLRERKPSNDANVRGVFTKMSNVREGDGRLGTTGRAQRRANVRRHRVRVRRRLGLVQLLKRDVRLRGGGHVREGPLQRHRAAALRQKTSQTRDEEPKIERLRRRERLQRGIREHVANRRGDGAGRFPACRAAAAARGNISSERRPPEVTNALNSRCSAAFSGTRPPCAARQDLSARGG